ncbi:MAG TPA: metal-binding protein [Cyanobacteria bacterium UBA8543]|nr:metal-binding protein [Cyanobacteria bacterium UBA8543]
MPSGRTHDRITLWSLPVVAGGTYALTHNGNLTLLLSGSFLFAGLMFGPDLDIYSRQYQRWGLLRWMWIPYQKSLRHRSMLSHGVIIGTVVRSLYLLGWIAVVGLVGLLVAEAVWDVSWTSEEIAELAIAHLQNHYGEFFAVFLGLELGAMSHYVSDWGGSAYKRFKGKVRKKRTAKTPRTPRVRGKKTAKARSRSETR